MWTNGSRAARSTPANARRTGKPSPSMPLGAGVSEATGRSTAPGKAEARRGRGTGAAVTGRIATIEALEYALGDVGREARPLVGHGEHHLVVRSIELDRDRCGRGRMDPNVVEEVVHHLPQPALVAQHRSRAVDREVDR